MWSFKIKSGLFNTASLIIALMIRPAELNKSKEQLNYSPHHQTWMLKSPIIRYTSSQNLFLTIPVSINVVFALITLVFSLWHLIKLWGHICSRSGSCLLNANNVLRNGTRAFLASATVRRPFERGWKGMASPRLLQITQCIPNERKTMPRLPTSCLIKRRQIHQCCSVVAAWLPFSHYLVAFIEADHRKSPITCLLRPSQPQRGSFWSV